MHDLPPGRGWAGGASREGTKLGKSRIEPMTSKQAHKTALLQRSRAGGGAKLDDLKQIHGIGPTAERRLSEAGIRTLAQLALASPEAIAARAAGLSAQRIAKENWIGQARQLSHRKSKPAPAMRPGHSPPADHQHYATFTVELLLDKANRVRRTRCAHVQSGDQETWPAWEAARLVTFVAEHASVRLSLPSASVSPNALEAAATSGLPQPELPSTPEAALTQSHPLAAQQSRGVQAAAVKLPAWQPPPDLVPVSVAQGRDLAEIETALEQRKVVAPAPAGTNRRAEDVRRDPCQGVRLHDMAVIANDADQPRQILPAGMLFCVRFSLDLTGIEEPVDGPFECLTSVYAKGLGAGAPQVIGERQDVIRTADEVQVEVGGLTLPAGVYRLEAVANLNLSGVSPSDPCRFTAKLLGNLLQVY
jgi:predicted flap endonuclease-1-like 5' DNA nuclease